MHTDMLKVLRAFLLLAVAHIPITTSAMTFSNIQM